MTEPFVAFRVYLIERDRSQLTINGYLADLSHYRRWFEQTNGEPFSPQVVTPIDVREYRQFLLNVERRKASTINRRLAALSAFMAWAKQVGLIEHDPTQNIRNVAQVNGGPKYLDKKQQYALQRAVEKDVQLSRLRYPKRWVARQRDASLVVVLLNTGLRLQEALDLHLSDVQIGDRKGQINVRHGKGIKQRIIPLNADARKALQEWMEVRPKGISDFLWVAVENAAKGPLSGRSVQRVILRLGQDAGLENLTPHMLRHSFAKNLLDNGVGLEKVAALLGHSNLNTTRVYITPNQNDLEKAVECLIGNLN
jgi:site-specific recombinase XerD